MSVKRKREKGTKEKRNRARRVKRNERLKGRKRIAF